MKSPKKYGVRTAIVATAATALFVSSIVTTNAPNQADAASSNTRNVILFIGDGMGAAQRDAIRLATVGEKGNLAMDSMPYVGLIHTSSTVPVTDSAASASAYASGVKTYNGAIGMDADKKVLRPLWNMLKMPGNQQVSLPLVRLQTRLAPHLVLTLKTAQSKVISLFSF